MVLLDGVGLEHNSVGPQPKTFLQLLHLLRSQCCSHGQGTHAIDRSFNDTLDKCLLTFSSSSQEKYTVHEETIMSVSSISITVHFCIYS